MDQRRIVIDLKANGRLYVPRRGFGRQFRGWIIKDSSGARLYLPAYTLNWSRLIAEAEAFGATTTEEFTYSEWSDPPWAILRRR